MLRRSLCALRADAFLADVLLLGQLQLRADELEHDLAALHHVAGLVDLQMLHPAVELRGDDDLAGFVRLYGAGRADGAGQWADSGSFGLDAELLHLVEADPDDVVVIAGFVLVDGDVVHPHRILLGLVGDIGQTHRIAVVENLSLASIGSDGRGSGRRVVDREIVHAHRILLRSRRDLRQAHGIAVEQDLGAAITSSRRR